MGCGWRRGWALFRLGRLEEAERDLRRALESAANAVMLDHLGDVLAARGRRAEAEGAWRQALDQVDATEQLKAALRGKLEGAQATPPDK